MNKGNILKSDADFDNAMFFGLAIEVIMLEDTETVDRGFVEGHDADTVTMAGVHYIKENCEFRSR